MMRPFDESSSLWRRSVEHFFRYHFPLTMEEMAGKVVMELGCGSGWNAGILLRGPSPIRFYVGLDISVFCVAMARYRFANHPMALFLHTVHEAGRISNLSGADVVFGKYFFIHQPKERIRPMIEFSHSMLSPGGVLVMDRQTVPFPWMADAVGEWVPGSEWSGFVTEREWLQQQLVDAGFVDVRFTPSGLYVRSLERDDVLEIVTARKG
jgi:SAM-dependent methyltransferase